MNWVMSEGRDESEKPIAEFETYRLALDALTKRASSVGCTVQHSAIFWNGETYTIIRQLEVQS